LSRGQAGEKIVVAGTQKVRNGITVSPTPFTEEKAAAGAPAQAPAQPEAAAPEKTQAQPRPQNRNPSLLRNRTNPQLPRIRRGNRI